jgi:hypothetical protein
MTGVCLWCGQTFAPRGTGGREQHFCRRSCRRELDAAARRFVADALGLGLLTVADLKRGPAATRALAGDASAPESVPDTDPADPALLAALRANGSVRLPAISIVPDAIAQLIWLAWLDQHRCRDAEALADAVVALATAALAKGLRAGSCEHE